MDIKQLRYFVQIVESENNLTKAAKKYHLSQPALSKMIKTFENEENILIFNRKNGKISELTKAGELLYEHALEIIDSYDNMLLQLGNLDNQYKGTVKIGIPPLVITIVFSRFLAKFILENPTIKLEITEAGAHELKKMLLVNDIDLAILLQPTELTNIEEYIIVADELHAFMSTENSLANRSFLTWEELSKQPLALFNESFMIHHMINKYFQKLNLKPNIKLLSGEWDMLLSSTYKSSIVSILPSPIDNMIQNKNFTHLPLKEPLHWEVTVCRTKKIHMRLNQYVLDEILYFFKTDSSALLLKD